MSLLFHLDVPLPPKSNVQVIFTRLHRRRQRGRKGPYLPKFLENIVILCFERRFSKQNSVIRLKSNISPPPKIFGLATPLPDWTFFSSWQPVADWHGLEIRPGVAEPGAAWAEDPTFFWGECLKHAPSSQFAKIYCERAIFFHEKA